MCALLKYRVKQIVIFEGAMWVGSFCIDRVPCCGGGGGGGGGGLLLCRDGQNTSRNPYPISNQNMTFSYPNSDCKRRMIKKCLQTIASLHDLNFLFPIIMSLRLHAGDTTGYYSDI